MWYAAPCDTVDMLSYWSYLKSNPLKEIHFKQIQISSYNTEIWKLLLKPNSTKLKARKPPKISLPLQKHFWSPTEWSRVWIGNDTLLNMPIALSKCVFGNTGRQVAYLLLDFGSASQVTGKIRTLRGHSDSAGSTQVQDGFLLLHKDRRKLVDLFSCWEWLG